MLDLVVVKVFDGVFDLEWLADDETVESAGDGSAAVIVRSPRGEVRVEAGDDIAIPISGTKRGAVWGWTSECGAGRGGDTTGAAARNSRPTLPGDPSTSLEEILMEKDREIEGLSESNRALQRSAIGNRDGRKAAEAEVARLRGWLERIYQQGRGPHVELARRALNGDPDA